jgi:DedD protein
MADPQINPEEQALRRRARRRLIGSLALALLAVLVLPMIFEPEPKPLGDDVEIIIPGQDTPFKSTPKTPPQLVTPAPEVTSPETPPASIEPEAKPAAKPAEPSSPKNANVAPTQAVKSDTQKPASKPAETKQEAPAAPATTHKVNPAKANENKTADAKVPEKKPAETKPAENKPTESKPATGGHALQLGSFSAESNARQQADKAKAAGFSVKVLAGQGVYKVRVGPYPTREAALEAQAQLKAKGFAPVLVSP